MSININGFNIVEIYKGSSPITELYKGSNLLFSPAKDWTQPILTANGTMGGDEFACSCSSNMSGTYAYYAFSTSSTTAWFASGGFPHWLSFYNPRPLKIDTMIIKQSYGESVGTLIGSFYPIIQISTDGIEWETIYTCSSADATVINSTFKQHKFSIDLTSIEKRKSKYWRIYAENTIVANNKCASIENISITAKEY